jgi:hypothetical protein
MLTDMETPESQFNPGDYKTLADVILDDIAGRLLHKLTPRTEPPPSWISGLALALTTLLVGALVSALAGEFARLTRQTIYMSAWAAGMGFIWLVSAQVGRGMLLTALEKIIAGFMVCDTDRKDLEARLARLSDVKRQALVSLGLGLIALIWPLIWTAMGADFPGFGPLAVISLVWFQTGAGVYLFIIFMGLPARLGRYRYEINAADASSSHLIEHLSGALNGILLIAAIILAAFTLGLALFQALGDQVYLVWVLCSWAALLILFFNNQNALSQIIKKNKEEKLREIQASIHALEVEGDITQKETLESINRLMDYHDRIKGLPDSALNIGEIFKLIQALLLPAITWLLANLKQVIEVLFN